MSKFKIVVPSKTHRLPADMRNMIDQGQADRVIAPQDAPLTQDGRAKLVTIQKGRLLVGDA